MEELLVPVTYRKHKNYQLLPVPTKNIAKVMDMAPIGLNEVNNSVQYHPIVLIKNSTTGKFTMVALFGFEKGENLLCQYDLWQETQAPLCLLSKPFYLGYQNDQGGQRQRVLCLDDSSTSVIKISKDEQSSQNFYTNRAQENTCLVQAKNVLAKLEQGEILRSDFIKCIVELKLIQALTLDITWDNGQSSTLSGLYTVDPASIENLTKSQQNHLMEQGYYQVILELNSSLSHIKQLIQLKNKQYKR